MLNRNSLSNPGLIKPAVEQDLNRQIQNGVLQRVDHSQWATPIVVVPKPSKAVRICGDFSITANPQLNINQYPLPRPEELFAALNGGQQFTKLDFSEAYLQLELDEVTQQFVVINTRKGLFKYTRLPFGITAALQYFSKLWILCCKAYLMWCVTLTTSLSRAKTKQSTC